MKTIYRAANSQQARTWACFAATQADAEAYLDNPGFGGSTLYSVEVGADVEVLDLAGGGWTSELRALAEAWWSLIDEAQREDLCYEHSGLGWSDVSDAIARDGVGCLEGRTVDGLVYSWTGRGLCRVYAVLEDRTELAEAIRESGLWSWIVYTDDYPAGCETWRYLGSAPLDLAEVGPPQAR